VQELAPLLRVGRLVGAVGQLLLDTDTVRVRLGWPVDELEDERASGNDAGTAG
jgi:hypothetical protein